MKFLTWQNPEQLIVAQVLIKILNYSVAEIRITTISPMSPPLSVKVMTLSFSKFISESLMILSRIPMNFMVIVSFGSTSIVKFPSMSAAVFFLESLAVMETLT